MSDRTQMDTVRSESSGSHDSVIDLRRSSDRLDRGPARRWTIILLLVAIGVAITLTLLPEQRKSGGPLALAAIGVARPAADPVEVSAGASASPRRFIRPMPGICAMTFPDPVQAAQIARQFRERHAQTEVDSRLPGEIQVELSHQLSSGRLIIKLDGRTVLSRPFHADLGEAAGSISHLLSVPAGQHGVEVMILGERGQIRGASRTTGRVPPRQVALLQAQQQTGTVDSLQLEWTVPEEPGGGIR